MRRTAAGFANSAHGHRRRTAQSVLVVVFQLGFWPRGHVKRATARMVNDVAAGRRSAYQTLFEDLPDWWETDHDRLQRQTVSAGDDDVADQWIGRLSSSVAARTSDQEAVDELPEPHRETPQLRCFSQPGYQEITDAIDVPIGTVRSRVSTGRRLLGAGLGL